MLVRLFVNLCALLSISICSGTESNSDKPRINCSCYVEEQTEFYPVLFELYRQAFAALGYEFSMQSINLAKANSAQRLGRMDGMCARTLEYGRTDSAKDMLLVDTLLSADASYLWTHKPELQSLSIDEVISGDYRVGFVRNHAAAQQAVEEFYIQNYRSPNSYRQLLELLDADRLDFIILINAESKMLTPLLGSRPLLKASRLTPHLSYPYLHKRHKQLAGPLARQLNKILSAPNHPLHQLVNTRDTRPKIHLTCLIPTNISYYQRLNQVLKTAFSKLNYAFSMEYNPVYRSQTSDLLTRTDGDCVRSDYYGDSEEGKQKLRVPVPINNAKYYLWSFDQALAELSLQSIRDNNHSIAVIKGDRIGTNALDRHHLNNRRTPADIPQALAMARSGRVDYFLFSDKALQSISRELEQTMPFSCHQLSQWTGYLYLNREHQALVEPLTIELQQLLEKSPLAENNIEN